MHTQFISVSVYLPPLKDPSVNQIKSALSIEVSCKPFVGRRRWSVSRTQLWLSSSFKEGSKVAGLRLLHKAEVILSAEGKSQ